MLTGIIALVIIIADQISKWWMIDILSSGKVTVIDDFFYLTLVYNRGAAFGIFPGRNYLFIILSIVTIAVLIFFYRSFFSGSSMARISGGLILGGAVGNLIDRFRFNHVVDFLDFKFGSYHWPAFNVADSAICVGVTILIVIVLLPKKVNHEDHEVHEVNFKR